jgi:hypothetical protein
MAALQWLEPIEAAIPAETESGFPGVPPSPLRVAASKRTDYRIYLTPEDTYLVVVTIAARTGPLSTTYQLTQTAASEEEAKAIAQADWDSGKRP